jgi:ABC-type glycerol-3-phosphate transport system substrate-binding protein
MKMTLAAAGLLAAATIAACGGGGHGKAYQDGYDEGLRGGSQAAGQTVTVDFWCAGRSAAYQGSDSDRNDYVAGCKEGFAKGQSH